MNRGEIRTLVREHVNEATAGFWSDATLNTHINTANKKLNATIAALDEDFFTVSATFSTAATTKSYSLPSDFRFMRRLERYNASDPNDIVKIDEIRFPRTEMGNEWPFGANGEPRRYVLRGNQIDLYPIPDAVYTLRIYYDQRQETFSDDSDTPTSPADFHEMIAIYAAILAKQKNNEDASVLATLYSDQEDLLISAIVGRKSADGQTVEGYLE